MSRFKTRIRISKVLDLDIPNWLSEGIINIEVDATGAQGELESEPLTFSVPRTEVINVLKNSAPTLRSYEAYLQWLRYDWHDLVPKTFTFTKQECYEVGPRAPLEENNVPATTAS